MATLTPQGQTAHGQRGSVRHSETARTRGPSSTIEALHWLRSWFSAR